MDIIGAIIGIIIFSPILLIVSVWIKVVSSDGPIFADIPARSGKDGEKFKMYKFRSMIPNAHEYLLQHPELHQKYLDNNYKLEPEEDPRFISGALFIRKFSIDEMPQFFNVLKGEMSIVGPRAYYLFELKEQAGKYPESVPYIEKLKTVKPGITGPWQVGGRSEVGFVDRVKMDAAYADQRSLVYDLLTILKTPFAMISAKGAY